MEIIWGSELSKTIKGQLKEKVAALKESGHRLPVLAVLLVL